MHRYKRLSRTRRGRLHIWAYIYIQLALCLFSSAVLSSSASYPLLDEVLSTAIFPPNKAECLKNQRSAETSFSDVFKPSHESHWNPKFQKYEELVFLIQMNHTDADSNKTWAIRIGKGGHVYSWIGAFGEAIPPQATQTAAWMDSVLQMVSVNPDLNTQEIPYFIHQAGSYMTDPQNGVPPPFYSPTLAMNYSASSCYIVSWGQQAHIPTPYISNTLYYTRYTDCGDGAIEITQIVHNAGKDTLGYLNVPWTGLRHSTFRDVALSRPNGTLNHQFPLKQFGEGTYFPALPELGGYTSFVQSLPIPENSNFTKLPCVTLNGKFQNACDAAQNTRPIDLVVRASNTCEYVAGLSIRYASYIVRIQVYNFEFMDTIVGCRQTCAPDGLIFINRRSGFTIFVQDLVTWVWRGKYVYISSNATDDEINAQFKEGDEIEVAYAVGGEKDLALTIVHGRDRESSNPNNTWASIPLRVRFGSIYNVDRDLLVFTVNFMGSVKQGQSYVNQYYAVVGRLSTSIPTVTALVNSTYHNILLHNERRAPDLHLEFDENSFCVVSATNGTNATCAGFSTPQNGTRPYFHVACGNESYVGPDQYHFAVNEVVQNGTVTVRPYTCHKLPLNIRPSWRLLGYFYPTDCIMSHTVTVNSTNCLASLSQ